MSHQITTRDNLFTVREPAWHGLGDVLTEYPTRQAAQAIAHPWEVQQEPVYRKVITVSDAGPIETFQELPGWLLNSRDDDQEPLGVVTDSYAPVTNTTLYDIAEAIEGAAEGSVRFETGGSLKGGRKVWLLVRLDEPLLLPGDPQGATIPYYALQNSHDGSGSFRGQATMTRIVCDNTAQAADLDAQARDMEFVFRHTSTIAERIEDAKNALAGWRMAITAFRSTADRLVELQLDDEQVERFVTEFIPAPAIHAASERVMANVEDARNQLRFIISGPTCAEIENTGWGMVQASIEYGQHYRKAQSGEARFKRAYLDSSVLTQDAVELVDAIALHS